MKKDSPKWIPEQEAAQKTGFKPKTLRRYCREGKLAISFTKLTGSGTVFYNQNDIERELNKYAIII